MFINRTLRAAALLLVAFPALAGEGVAFHAPYAQSSSPTMGAAYFSAVSEADDAIIGLTSDCCTAVELHENVMDGNVMRMRKLDRLALKAGVPVEVAPTQGNENSRHIMLIDPKKPLQKGDRITIAFTFEKAPKKTVTFTVGAPGKAVPTHDHSHMHHE